LLQILLTFDLVEPHQKEGSEHTEYP
jgi:hypothetical protein